MRHIDEDTITQAVIARHAAARDARLREVVTSLVQHLHAFARDVKLTEPEWAEGVRFLAECGRVGTALPQQEVALLSDALGLSMLVTALNHRTPKGCTESTPAGPYFVDGAPRCGQGDDLCPGAAGEPCYVHIRVCSPGGTPIAGAEVQVWQCGADGRYDAQDEPAGPGLRARGRLLTGADGCVHFKTVVAAPHAVAHDGPVGRLLRALGRHPWRPAHLHFMISAPGHERLVTQVYRRGDPYLDADAVFGVRSSLVADWVHHEPGRTPDDHTSDVPFTTLDFTFVLNGSAGDKP
jgi:hydroxyquinol 1,2-dioxygenase